MRNLGYTYKREELGEVSFFLPLALLALVLGLGGWLLYKKKKNEDDYEDEEVEETKPTSGSKSIAAVEQTIKRMRANPELVEEADGRFLNV